MLHGSSIGGGLLLGLTADYRVATENATFRLGVAPYGLSPVVMATEVLPMLVGWPYSTRMYVEDLVLDAREALGAGVSSHVRPDSETARCLARSQHFFFRSVASPYRLVLRRVRLLSDFG